MTNFIDHAKGLTKNPLGIIALFVSLIYGFACLVLSTSISNLKTPEERLPLIWFIIMFPLIILIGFIFLVTKHHGKLYSPSDYGDPESFLKTIEGAKKFEPVQVETSKNTSKIPIITKDIVKSAENEKYNKELFLPETQKHLKLVNNVWGLINKLFQEEISKEVLAFGYGIQAPEYFIFSFTIFNKFIKKNVRNNLKNQNIKENIIVRVTEKDGNFYLIAIGKDIIVMNSAFEFAEKFKDYIQTKLDEFVDYNEYEK